MLRGILRALRFYEKHTIFYMALVYLIKFLNNKALLFNWLTDERVADLKAQLMTWQILKKRSLRPKNCVSLVKTEPADEAHVAFP